MPFEMRWIPAPINKSLIAHKEKPEDLSYECQYCDGWIEGQPSHHKIDTLYFSFAGGRGTEEYCQRCGEKIGFFGIDETYEYVLWRGE